MAGELQKQTVSVNFAQGLDTKTDPWQLPVGRFTQLVNSVFSAPGGQGGQRLNKRNGFGPLAGLPTSAYNYLTTLNGGLVAIGDTFAGLSQATDQWTTHGTYQQVGVSAVETVRNSQDCTRVDSVVTPKGLALVAWTQQTGSATSGLVTTQYLYEIVDQATGQVLVEPSLLRAYSTGTITGASQVFLVGNYFVIVSPVTVSGSSYLQYVAIPITSPTTVSSPAQCYTDVLVGLNAWDGVVFQGSLYLSFNTTSGGQGIDVIQLTQQEIAASSDASGATKLTGTATTLGVCVDPTSKYIWTAFYNQGSGDAFVGAVDYTLQQVATPYLFSTSGSIVNLTLAADYGYVCIFGEIAGTQGYDATISTNSIYCWQFKLIPPFYGTFSSGGSAITVAAGVVALLEAQGVTTFPETFLTDATTPANITQGTYISSLAGTTINVSGHTFGGNSASSPGDKMSAYASGNAYTVLRGVGLASKAFLIGSTVYFLAAFQSPYQPTYFLIQGPTFTSTAMPGETGCVVTSPVIVGKLAYENGGGYLSNGLPNVTVLNNEAYVSYLYKDLAQALVTLNNSQQTTSGGIYTQTGANLGNLSFTNQPIAAEAAGALHAGGGFLWEYDGQNLYEHGFFLWPEQVEYTYNDASAVTPTGTASNGATAITLSSGTDVHVGMTIADTTNSTYIPAGTTIVSISGTSAVMSAAATHAISGDSLSIQGNIWAQPDGATNTDAYYYQVCYAVTDAAGMVHRSAPSIPLAVTTTSTAKAGTITLSIPTLRETMKVLGAAFNGAAGPVRIEIYRWSVENESYFEVTSPAAPLLNNTAIDYVTFVDVYPDSEIVGNQLIYTTGGVVEDINGPASDVVTLFDTRLWVLDAEDPNLWWYSKTLVQGVPVEMSDLLTYYIQPSVSAQGPTGPVTAAAPMDDKFVMFKRSAIYYINGTGPDSTGQNSQYSQPIFVVSPVGCVDQSSIVMTPTGLMFQAADGSGIWLLDRFNLQVSYVGAAVEAYNGYQVNSSACPPGNTQVRQTLVSGQQLMFDYYYGQWGTFSGAAAVSSCIYNGLHTILTPQGTVLQETPGSYADGTTPVLMSFTTGWISLAGIQGYERLYEMSLLAAYQSPHGLLCSIAYDFGPITETKIIRPNNRAQSYGNVTPYGTQQQYGGPGKLEQWKISVQRQTCQAFQITIQEIPDPSAQQAGAGFTASGLAMTVGLKKGRRPIGPAQSI